MDLPTVARESLNPTPSLAEVSAAPGQNFSVKSVLQLVEPVGRTCAANVGESVLCDHGVGGVPNNLPMPDSSFPQRGHSAPHLRASKCLKNPVSLVWKGGEDSRS